MNIKFNKINIHNFMSFEDAELELANNGFTLVMGINKNVDDNALSNGSGKSSLWEAISWCLTGETIRGAKDVKRIGSEDTCSVTLSFLADGIEYEVIRTKDPSNLKVFVNGEDKSGKGIRDTQQILSQLLPDLTSSLIGSVIILGQGLPQRFTNNSPSGRKDVLEKLSKSDFMIEDLKQRINNRKTDLSKQERALEDAILVATTKLNVSKSNKERAEIRKESLLKSDTGAMISSIEEMKSSKDEMENRVSELQAELSELKDEIYDNQQRISDIKLEHAEEKNKLQEALMIGLSPYQTELSSYNAQINTLRQTIAKIKSIKDICPTCGQRLPDVVKPSTVAEEAQLQELTVKSNEVSDKISQIRQDNAKELSTINEKFSHMLVEVEAVGREIAGRSKPIEAELSQKTQSIREIDTKIVNLQRNIDSLEQEITLAEATIQQAAQDIDTFTSEILYNNREKEGVSSHLEVINKMSTLITRDFRGYLLTNVIDYINKQSKSYSKDIFDTDKIEFSLVGNNISISYCGKEYESLSGGEKQKIDLIVQFAIRDMLCNFLDFSCNILALDEIADNIDSVGAERLFSTIATKISDVESIFIISHHQDFDMPVDKEIKIVKGDDGISRIE